MKGVAVFKGGPLDEQIRMLPDLAPDYRVPYRDITGPIAQERIRAMWSALTAVGAAPTELVYRRTRRCRGCEAFGGQPHAIYELLL